MQKPSIFNSLPGISIKTSSLADNADNFERLSAKLEQIETLGLWHEPVDLDDRLSAFVKNTRLLLLPSD